MKCMRMLSLAKTRSRRLNPRNAQSAPPNAQLHGTRRITLIGVHDHVYDRPRPSSGDIEARFSCESIAPVGLGWRLISLPTVPCQNVVRSRNTVLSGIRTKS